MGVHMRSKLCIGLLAVMLPVCAFVYLIIVSPLLSFLFLCLVLVAGFWIYFGLCHCKYEKTNMAHVLPAKQKLLVVIPHPDDELNIAGVLMRNVLLREGQVFIIYTTNFDAYGEKVAQTRLKEIKKLCDRLSIPGDNIFYMGYQASLYHEGQCADSERYTFALGKEETCAKKIYGKEVLQTFVNMEDMLYEIISRIEPDVICGIDCDSHEDHRIASVALDQVIDRMSQEKASQVPLVLKGFSYATAWRSVPDFYVNKNYLNSSIMNYNDSSDTSKYDWEARVRIPYINSADLGHTLRSSYLYRCYAAYMSQNALSHMNQIINGDQVFWVSKSYGNERFFSGTKIMPSNKISYHKIASYPQRDFLYEVFCEFDKSYQVCIVNEYNKIEKDTEVRCFFVEKGIEKELSSSDGIYTIRLQGNRASIICKKGNQLVDSIRIYSNRGLKHFVVILLRECELILDWYLKRYRTHMYSLKMKYWRKKL